MTDTVRIKRCHGLGNVVCLLPVLDRLSSSGNEVIVQTNQAWIEAFSTLRPDISWTATELRGCFDLDSMTDGTEPCEHRADEFGRMLGVEGPWPDLFLDVPASWRAPYAHLYGCVIFAPEGGHASRCWPNDQACEIKGYLPNDKVVLVGQNNQPKDIPCDVDTRATLNLTGLFGILSVAKSVITMDSAVLHIAAGLQKPTVVVFGGVDPRFRIRQQQPVVVLQADLPCCPCNKNETCNDAFPCIAAATPSDVINALEIAENERQLVVQRIDNPVTVAG